MRGFLKLYKCGDKTSNRKGEAKCRKQAIIGYILPAKGADTPMQVFCVHIQILNRTLNNVKAHSWTALCSTTLKLSSSLLTG